MALPEGPPSRPLPIGVVGPGSLAELNDVHDYSNSHQQKPQKPLEKKPSTPVEVDTALVNLAKALLAGKDET